MHKSTKQSAFAFLAASIFAFASCSKDEPTPELPQEDVGKAKLVFLEVEREAHGDHYHYNDFEDADSLVVNFDANGQADVNHADLEEGKTYRLSLTAYNLLGKESQAEFVKSHDNHQAFILGAPTGTLEYVYADRDPGNTRVNVGVTGYLTVTEASDSFVFNYVLRHLQQGVKSSITAADWNNPQYTQFGGSNDLDLKFELHLVEGHGHDH